MDFHDLEDPICNAHSMAAILLDRLHSHFTKSHEGVTGNSNFYYLSDEDVDCILFAAGQLKSTVGKVKTDFYKADSNERSAKQLPKAA